MAKYRVRSFRIYPSEHCADFKVQTLSQNIHFHGNFHAKIPEYHCSYEINISGCNTIQMTDLI